MKKLVTLTALVSASLLATGCASQGGFTPNATTTQIQNGAINGAVAAAVNGGTAEQIKQGAINGAVSGLLNSTQQQQGVPVLPPPIPKR